MPINYVLLDAARMNGHLHEAQNFNEQHSCLYNGKDEKYMQTVAPYLFSYQPSTNFATWLWEEGWGNSWGVFVFALADNEELNLHFRKFKTVKTEDGTEPYFRFYDPRVLRIFLPTCDAKQLLEFFGPVNQFICEDEEAENTLIFSLRNNALHTEKVSTSKLFPATIKP